MADDAATEELASDADTEELAGDASTGIRAAINDLSEKLARFVAKNPETLDRLEWRDLERVVAEVFAGLGFEVELTPGSKDGGKDVVVSFHHAGKKSSYLIEVKHWLDTRVGYAVVSRFVHVVARDGGSGGLFCQRVAIPRQSLNGSWRSSSPGSVWEQNVRSSRYVEGT